MAKRIKVDGKYYRKRRGKLVEIPPEWVGRVTTPGTIRRRKSKQINKRKRGKGLARQRRFNTLRP